MINVASVQLTPTPFSALLTSACQELSPSKIRQSIADLVRQNCLKEADALSREALGRFPHSEDILVIRALVTQVVHNWDEASEALEKLIVLQGPQAQAVTWSQWVRVLRCQGDNARAMNVAAQGLANHPLHPQLLEEFNTLQRASLKSALKAA